MNLFFVLLSIISSGSQQDQFIDYSAQETVIIEYNIKPYSRDEVIEYIASIGESNNTNTWLRLMDAESNFCYYDYGLHSNEYVGCLQISQTTANWVGCDGDLLDYRRNLDCGVKVRNIQGWTAWETY